MILSTEAAKAFCKVHSLKGLDIRSTTSIRVIIRIDNQLYRIRVKDVNTSKIGLFRAAELAKEYKQLAKYNFDDFLRLTLKPNCVDEIYMAKY
ncbi:hypothetical protein, partial [uncultured Paraglaciecola sp.]|uniref:hypothetical protein n=1 Tax=uncultured Paraglaciecola sp. TaxID=1765024 RepID=UPI0030D7592F